ncbi:MAG: glucuronate isomerase [Bryobacteraceae bacterium]
MPSTKSHDATAPEALSTSQIRGAVEDVLHATKFIDVHTHLCMPSLGALGLWGIDNLLTYHYLEAELFRSSRLSPDEYWRLSLTGKADAVWRALFVENAPVSEATRGVVAVLAAFGLPTDSSGLKLAREFFADQKVEAHISRVFDLAGVSEVVMTNDPLDPAEAPLWESGAARSPRFHAALRLDRILNQWPEHWQALAARGYAVDAGITGRSLAEVRRFLADWVRIMRPAYMACSLTDAFQYPEDSACAKLIGEAVIPSCRELDLPLSLMIGVRRQVNPALRLAGDACGKADLRALERLCRDFPDNRFLVSVLSRENQHELCVYARKFANLMPFGCWWFLNNPSVVEEIARERLEMLGTSFIPQHSDARILEQTIYKWRNTRRTMAPILANAFELMAADGRAVTRVEIQREITRLFRTNFEQWTRLRS